MSEKIKKCYERLQTLQITPTVGNMETLLQSLYDLRSVYQELKAKEAEQNGGTETDPQ